MKIIISERQYSNLVKSIMLSEQKTGCNNVNYKLSKVLYYGDDGIPPDYILYNPFNDGFDYQFRIMDNCKREWIRRTIKNRSFDKYDLYKGADSTVGKNKDQIFINKQTDPKLFSRLYNLIKTKGEENKKSETISSIGGGAVASVGFKNNIKNQLDGDKFRTFVHSNPNRLKNVNDYLKKKGLNDSLSKTGGWNNIHIKTAWEAPCGEKNGIKLNMGDCFTAEVKVKESVKSDVNSVKKMFLDNGFGSFFKFENRLINAKTGNQIYAYASLYALRELTLLIAQKTISGANGKTEINVLKKEPGYYNASNFSVNVAQYLNSKTVCGGAGGKGLPTPYVCFLSDFYYNFDKLVSEYDSAFSNNKYEVSTNLFPNGVYQFFTQYFGTDNYNDVYNYAKSITGDKICNGIESIDPKGKPGTSIWDPSTWGISSEDILNVAEFLLPFIPVIGPAVSAVVQINQTVNSFKRGDYIDGTFRMLAAVAPFVKPTSFVSKINKNLPSAYVSIARYVPPEKQTLIIKLGEKFIVSKAKDIVSQNEKIMVKNVVNNISDLTKEADDNIRKIKKLKPNDYETILKDISNGKKSISDYIS